MQRALRFILFVSTVASGQPTFEITSVKPARPDATERSLSRRPGARLAASNASLRMLILLAYQVMPFQLVGGPSWMASDGFDIEAKAADPNASPEQFRELIRTMLADRFHLKVHSETKELRVYELVVAKNGTSLVEDKADRPEVSMRNGRGEMTGVKATMSMFAGALTRLVQRKVVDATGLKGSYSFQLRFQPEETPQFRDDGLAPTDIDSPSLFTALQEQLGLTLRSSRGPVEVLVVDGAQRPSEN